MTPSINILGYIEKDQLPDWVLNSSYDSGYKFYNLTVNNKKCYLAWKNEYTCMLYIDGYPKPGFDIDNAVYRSTVCYKFFGVNNKIMDHALNQAVKKWEFRQNIKQHNPHPEFDDFLNAIL